MNLRDRKLSNEIDADADTEVTVAGWIQEIRNLGGVAFLILRDSAGTCQITLIKKEMDFFREVTSLPRESVVGFTGTVQKNDRVKGGFEILPSSWELFSRAETPLPLGVIDKVGAELDTRLNNRFMDLRKEEVRSIFRIRSDLMHLVRQFFQKNGFVEVTTPKIVAEGAEGGATLFSVDYFGKEAYLAQSPQLYKQMLMASGFNRIFEIGPAFRAEQSDTVRHIAEFTSLDVEMAFIESSEDIMSLLEHLVHWVHEGLRDAAADDLEVLGIDLPVPSLPVPRVSYADAIDLLSADSNIEYGHDMDTEAEKKLGAIMKEKHNADIYFITDFPVELKKGTFYAMRNADNPELTGYFDMDFLGQELVSGGQREHRYDALLSQMNEAGLNPSNFEFYLSAFRYGMPPHGGFGLGIERWLQKIMNLSNIRECVLFPRDMYRLRP